MPPALTAEQLAIYRSKPSWAEPRLYIDRPVILYQAQINLPAGALYPVTSVVTDNVIQGNIANVEEGMLVAFGSTPGLSDLGRQVAKSTSGGAVINMPRTSNGKVDGTIDLINDKYVTVYDTFPPWAWLPYNIQGTDTFYKYSDWDFATYGLKLLPICNINAGSSYADQVNDSDLITLSLDSSSSFSPEGVAISSRLWDVKDGTITVGSATSPAITVTFPVGRRIITCQVTDANGKTSKKRRLLVVACKDGTAYEAITAFKLTGPLRHTVDGQSLSFEIFQDIPEIDYIDGCAICYFVHERYGDGESSLNSSVVKFSGWHHVEQANIDARPTYLRRKTKIDALDTAGKLATLPAFPQVVEGAASPTRWEEMTSPNADKYLAYLWLYHSNASMLADFQWSGVGASYPFTRLGSNGGTLWEQLDGRARAIGGYYRLLSDALGRVRVKADPLTQEVADRTATNTIDLSEDDWVSLGWTGQRPARSHWLNGSAIIANASSVLPTFVIAPGLTPGQGTSENNIGEMLVISQTKLSEVCGQAFLRENAPRSYFRIKLLHGGDASYEPLDFVRLTMTAETAAQRGLTFTNRRFLIVAVETSYDNATGIQEKSLTLEEETQGNMAFPLTPYPGEVEYPESVFEAVSEALPPPVAYPSRLLLLTSGGHAVRATQTVPGETPNYTSIASAAVVNRTQWLRDDPFNHTTYYALFDDKIVKITDVWGTPAQSTVYTLPSPKEAVGNLDASITRAGFFAWLVRDPSLPSGFCEDILYQFAYTTDYFASVNYVTLPGGACPDEYPGVAISCHGSTIFAAGLGHGNSPGQRRAVKSTDWGLSWSILYSDLGQYSGHPYVVFNGPGGAPDTTDQYALHEANNTIKRLSDNSSLGVASISHPGNKVHYSAINALTVDASYLAVTLGASANFSVSDSYGQTWQTRTAPRTVDGVNGFPSNPNYLLLWARGTNALVMTFDRGQTFVDLTDGYAAAAAVGGWGGIHYALGDLSEWYNVPIK